MPECHCASTRPPGGLRPAETPQFILVTFDDAIHSFSESFVNACVGGLQNPDGRMAPRTYFVNRENTEIEMARKLHSEGHELANHTATHKTSSATTAQEWRTEIKRLNQFLVNEIGIPSDQIAGFRAPYLATNEAMWQVLRELNFIYDSSLPEIISNPPVVSTGIDAYVWPHTLDHRSGLSCVSNHCPDNPVPGLWSIPMWAWTSEDGSEYGAMDPAVGFNDKFRDLLNYNFEQRYRGNRAPLGIYLHAGQMWDVERQQILRTFLQESLKRPGVWMITMRGLIEWMREPIRASEMSGWFARKCDRGVCRDEVVAPAAVPLVSPRDGARAQLPTVSLNWEVLLTASRYHLQVSTTPNFSTTLTDNSSLTATVYEANELANATKYYWRVRAINAAGAGSWSEVWSFTSEATTVVEAITGDIPKEFSLEQGYPNPFNPAITLEFALPKTTYVTLKIYNSMGEDITTLVNETMAAGKYKIRWNGGGFASGNYFCRMNADDFVQIKKMILVQ